MGSVVGHCGKCGNRVTRQFIQDGKHTARQFGYDFNAPVLCGGEVMLDFTPSKLARTTCPACGQNVPVAKSGNIVSHFIGRGKPCNGGRP